VGALQFSLDVSEHPETVSKPKIWAESW